jgi:hypothetical protein
MRFNERLPIILCRRHGSHLFQVKLRNKYFEKDSEASHGRFSIFCVTRGPDVCEHFRNLNLFRYNRPANSKSYSYLDNTDDHLLATFINKVRYHT